MVLFSLNNSLEVKLSIFTYKKQRLEKGEDINRDVWGVTYHINHIVTPHIYHDPLKEPNCYTLGTTGLNHQTAYKVKTRSTSDASVF